MAVSCHKIDEISQISTKYRKITQKRRNHELIAGRFHGWTDRRIGPHFLSHIWKNSIPNSRARLRLAVLRAAARHSASLRSEKQLKIAKKPTIQNFNSGKNVRTYFIMRQCFFLDINAPEVHLKKLRRYEIFKRPLKNSEYPLSFVVLSPNVLA